MKRNTWQLLVKLQFYFSLNLILLKMFKNKVFYLNNLFIIWSSIQVIFSEIILYIHVLFHDSLTEYLFFFLGLILIYNVVSNDITIIFLFEPCFVVKQLSWVVWRKSNFGRLWTWIKYKHVCLEAICSVSCVCINAHRQKIGIGAITSCMYDSKSGNTTSTQSVLSSRFVRIYFLIYKSMNDNYKIAMTWKCSLFILYLKIHFKTRCRHKILLIIIIMICLFFFKLFLCYEWTVFA